MKRPGEDGRGRATVALVADRRGSSHHQVLPRLRRERLDVLDLFVGREEVQVQPQRHTPQASARALRTMRATRCSSSARLRRPFSSSSDQVAVRVADCRATWAWCGPRRGRSVASPAVQATPARATKGDSPIFGPTLRVAARKSGQSPAAESYFRARCQAAAAMARAVSGRRTGRAGRPGKRSWPPRRTARSPPARSAMRPAAPAARRSPGCRPR